MMMSCLSHIKKRILNLAVFDTVSDANLQSIKKWLLLAADPDNLKLSPLKAI